MKRKTYKDTRFLPRIDMGWRNILLFLIGLIILVVGFYLSSIAPWDNPLSRTVAPLVLLFGYLIIFPIAIFLRPGSERREQQQKTGSTAKDK
ncbi:hypothetical protein HQ587_11620 [bacterium]|nr:hypothetical protein [bacterium]